MIVQPGRRTRRGSSIAAGCFPFSFNAPKCRLSLALASVVQGDAVNCNKWIVLYCV